jgi:hypothetical protein
VDFNNWSKSTDIKEFCQGDDAERSTVAGSGVEDRPTVFTNASQLIWESGVPQG